MKIDIYNYVDDNCSLIYYDYGGSYVIQLDKKNKQVRLLNKVFFAPDSENHVVTLIINDFDDLLKISTSFGVVCIWSLEEEGSELRDFIMVQLDVPYRAELQSYAQLFYPTREEAIESLSTGSALDTDRQLTAKGRDVMTTIIESMKAWKEKNSYEEAIEREVEGPLVAVDMSTMAESWGEWS